MTVSVIAIALALIFKEVVTSLFIGVWVGGLFIAGLNPLTGTLRTIDTFITPVLVDYDHAAIGMRPGPCRERTCPPGSVRHSAGGVPEAASSALASSSSSPVMIWPSLNDESPIWITR